VELVAITTGIVPTRMPNGQLGVSSRAWVCPVAVSSAFGDDHAAVVDRGREKAGARSVSVPLLHNHPSSPPVLVQTVPTT